MARSVPEWQGKTPDAKIPPRVKARVYDRAKGICHWCKLPIKAPAESWQADHVKALINGGEHRESNLAPIHAHCHIEKTGIDVKEKAKIAKKRQAHLGIKAASRPIQSRGFAKSPKPRHERPSLPPRQMFAQREASE